MSFHETKLITSKDWDVWLNVVKSKSTSYHIWSLVNPALNTKPTLLPEPQEPAIPYIPDIALAGDISKAVSNYKLQLTKYKTDLARWEKQQSSLTGILDFLYASISNANLIYLESVEVHPWDYLRALKAKMAPWDPARSLAIEKEYHRVRAGPTSRQSAEAWMDEWTQTLARARDDGLAETSDPARVYRDFFLAIEEHAPMLSSVCEFSMSSTMDFTTALATAEEMFRRKIRPHSTKEIASHSLFAIGNTTSNTSNNAPGPSRQEPQNPLEQAQAKTATSNPLRSS